MILTTTPSVEGRTIAEYKGIVFGDMIIGFSSSSMKLYKGIDILSSKGYSELKARGSALVALELRAREKGADAVVGINIDNKVLNDGMLMVTASGTAVKLV